MSRFIRFACGLLACIGLASGLVAQTPPAPLTVLTVGGGPDPDYNQVAIESNVRYVDSLLPASVSRRVLFADGKTTTADVLYREDTPAKSPGEAAFRLLFEAQAGSVEKFRTPHLPRLDAPATRASLHSEIDRLAKSEGNGPVLLYFTGHGSPGKNNLVNNTFGLWRDDEYSVRDLASEIKRLPSGRPVILVMVQCFSGAFGNLQFEGGDAADDKLIDRPLCGFFATTAERVAAGCTSEVNEAEYHDFTGAFFAALTGRDRLGKQVKATDYNRDGIIGMDEAWAYAVLTEPSIDVPVTTSDVFLRHFVPINDDEVVATPFSKIQDMASPLQRGLLEGLSTSLNATGETRLRTALDEVRKDAQRGRRNTPRPTGKEQTAKYVLSGARIQLTAQFPDLKDAKSPRYVTARTATIAFLDANQDKRDAILTAAPLANGPATRAYADELRGAKFLRLMRVAKTVLLEKRLREGGNTVLIERFNRLRALEAANPLH